MIVFEANRGRVVRMDEPAAQARLSFLGIEPGARISYDVHRSIVTRFTVSQRVNVQFLHTVGQFVYVYVFGDRMGAVNISGVSYSIPCDVGRLEVGSELMLRWYRTYRLSELGAPIRIAIGNLAMDGFVVGTDQDLVSPELGLVQWNVSMQMLPDQ